MTLSRILFILFLWATFIGIGACQDSVLSPADPDPSDSIPDQAGDTLEIMPLAVGNRWIYRVQEVDHYDTTGIFISTTYDTLEIVNRHLIDGEWWYEDNNGHLFANRSNGNWFRDSLTDSVVKFLARYPAVVGNVDVMYTSLTPLIKDISLVHKKTVTSTDTTISVPAGSYQGILYRMDLDNVDGTSFLEEVNYALYTPGVGLIREESYGLYGQPKFRTPYVSTRWDLMEVVLR